MTDCENILRVAVVLLSPCSLLTAGCLLEPFHAANRVDGRVRYRVACYSPDGKPVGGGSVALPVDGALSDEVACDLLLVGSDAMQPFADHSLFSGLLSRLAARVPQVAGVHGGVWWLARAGLLKGCRAAVHWEDSTHFVERYPDIVVSQNLYEIDRFRLTACSALAAADLLLTLIGRRHGPELATAVAERLCLERVRRSDERQRVPLAMQIGAGQPKLSEALQLMEANVEEPLSTEDVSALVGLSRRQLERLFKQHLDTLPSRYYLELRLSRARHLLQRTAKSIVQVGLSCGFSSGPHFSTAYRVHFGITPREERARSAGFGCTEEP